MSDKLNLNVIKELLAMARGGDPFAQALLQEIFKVEEVQQKTNFPTAINQQKQTYLKTAQEFYSDDDHFGEELANPFRVLSDWDAITWQGYKGFLVDNYKEMLKKGTDLSGVLMPPAQEPAEKKRFWQRNKKQGEVLSE